MPMANNETARMDGDLAAVFIDNGRGAARTDHDGITDIGIGGVGDRLKTLTLIDGEIAGARLDYSSPGRAGCEHRTAD